MQLLGGVCPASLKTGRLIDSGGSGYVYEATDSAGIRYALKKVPDPSLRARLQQEFDITHRIKIPGTVRSYAYYLDDESQLCLLMEFLTGVTCEGLNHASVAKILEIATELARVLAQLHERGWIHRDIKPSNVMVGQSHVTLIDFGIAVKHGTRHRITATGQLIGTPEYMAPEQWRGAECVSTATDIFALGGLVYYLVTGKTPFTFRRREGIRAAAQLALTSPFPEVDDGADPRLRDLIELCTQRAPEDRPSAREIVEQLSRGKITAVTRKRSTMTKIEELVRIGPEKGTPLDFDTKSRVYYCEDLCFFPFSDECSGLSLGQLPLLRDYQETRRTQLEVGLDLTSLQLRSDRILRVVQRSQSDLERVVESTHGAFESFLVWPPAAILFGHGEANFSIQLDVVEKIEFLGSTYHGEILVLDFFKHTFDGSPEPVGRLIGVHARTWNDWVNNIDV